MPSPSSACFSAARVAAHHPAQDEVGPAGVRPQVGHRGQRARQALALRRSAGHVVRQQAQVVQRGQRRRRGAATLTL